MTGNTLLFHHAADRAVLRVSGDEAVGFLQGIVSNDVERVGPDRAIWAALLTPQGKYLHDFFICRQGHDLLLDCEAGRMDDLQRRLKRFTLRSRVSVSAANDFAVGLLFGADAPEAASLTADAGAAREAGGGVLFMDPRLAAAGVRAVLPAREMAAFAGQTAASEGTAADWDRHRLALGLPDGSRDMEVEKTILLEAGFDELNGVDWDKGCYMGQEVTARTYHRGLLKKRLVPVEIEGDVPAPDTPLLDGDRAVGEMRSAVGDLGMALLRLEAVKDGGPIRAGDTTLRPQVPEWMRLPD